MSYVGSPFEHDLFISYSHGDDGEGHPLLRPWSVAFVEALKAELRLNLDPRARRELKIFLDADHRPGDGVDPMAGLTPQLEAQIAGAGLLVVLMSDDYLLSAWCGRERDWWCAEQAKLGLPTDKRIAVLRILPTTGKWPAALCDPQGEPLVGFRLHGDPVPGVAVRPFGWNEVSGATRPNFGDGMQLIVGRLTLGLGELKERAASLRQARAEAEKLQQGGGQALYLHGREAQQEKWREVSTSLLDAGYLVMPGEPDPEVSDPQAWLNLRKRRVEVMANCDALLLLGDGDGRLLDSDLLAVGRQDRASACAQSRRPLPCGVFDTVGAQIATPVRRATARNIRADWLDGTQQPWAPRINDWLTAKGQEAEQQL
jgi:hypothetical protein